jgi:DNA-binding Xre family transcriptional regulator
VSQAALLVDVVKKTLRHRGLTYVDVAKGLKLSESSVKRMFAQRHLSLNRLEQICALMHLEIADLLELTRSAEGRITELSEEQERELVSEPRLLLVGTLALSHWTAGKMLETYRFSETELVALLARLDRLRIIDLLPGNRIKVRLQRNFNWRKGGPIQRFFEEQVQRQFFESSFLRKGELRVSVHGSISDKSNGLLQERMRKVAEEFDRLVEEDRHLAHEMREGTSLVMAMRPWELNLFGELRRNEESRAAGRTGAPTRPERRRN